MSPFSCTLLHAVLCFRCLIPCWKTWPKPKPHIPLHMPASVLSSLRYMLPGCLLSSSSLLSASPTWAPGLSLLTCTWSCHPKNSLPFSSTPAGDCDSVSPHLNVPLLWAHVLQAGGILDLHPCFHHSRADWFCYCFRNDPLSFEKSIPQLKNKNKTQTKPKTAFRIWCELLYCFFFFFNMKLIFFSLIL